MTFPGRSWWQRLRHSRGFGVHSPFAYRFIREVLRERCAYYAYADVDTLAAAWPGGRAGARLLLRLCVWRRPSLVAVCGDEPAASAAVSVARSVSGRARVEREVLPGCDMIVFCASATPRDAEAAFDACSRGALLVATHRHRPVAAALIRRLRDELPYGHLFINGSGAAIFVGRSTLPAEVFKVRF